MTANSLYRSTLERNLRGYMNEGQVSFLLDRFDKISAVSSDETSFRVLHTAYASTDDTEEKVTSIRAELEKLNAGQKLEINPCQRLANYAIRMNAMISKMDVLIDGLPLSDAEKSKAKIHIPPVLQIKKYTATASFADGKKRELGVIVSYHR